MKEWGRGGEGDSLVDGAGTDWGVFAVRELKADNFDVAEGCKLLF